MKSPRNYWPIGIILTFAVFICGTACLIVLACTHKMDLVSADYYEQEIRYQRQLDQLSRSGSLSQPASVAYERSTHSIKINLRTESHHQGVSGRIHLYRPSAASLDRNLSLDVDDQGVQFVDAASLRPGLWKVRVSWKIEDREYFMDQSIVIVAEAKRSAMCSPSLLREQSEI